MATTAAAVNRPAPRDKFIIERTAVGGMTYITLKGTLNVDFVGKKLAKASRAKKIVINMYEVRRFASWGMSEWMDFLRICQDRDIYIVECSSYALSQLNLITGLLGHAKLVSYYASFRCGTCSAEIESRFIVPRDRETIRDLPSSQHECPRCQGLVRLEEYPAAFFETIAERPSFDIDDEVLGFLRTQLNYDIAPDLTRFRAYRISKNGYTYMRLSGSVAELPPEVLMNTTDGTTIVDLEGIVYDLNDLTPWRTYLKAALSKVKAVQLLNVPMGFLEYAIRPADMREALKIRTFTLPYECVHCERTAAHVVDVANNLEQLAEGTAPTVRCPTCRAPLVAALTMNQAGLLQQLPARDRDGALDKFLAGAQPLPIDKLENCLTFTPVEAPKPAQLTRKTLLLAGGVATALVGAVVVAGVWMWQDRKNVVVAPPTTPEGSGSVPERDKFVKPDWIISSVPSSAYCQDVINRLMCVGVSAYRTSRDEGVTEASDAALEELVNAVALKIAEPSFRDSVIPIYTEARSKVLSALQTADLDRKTDAKAADAYKAADAAVRAARKRVVEILQVSGGAAVPTQRSDWYWEEYAGENGGPNEMLVWVRYDVSLDALRTLVETYSSTTLVDGSAATTAFPALAWRDPEFTGGAQLFKVSKQLAASGIEPQTIVMAVNDQRITDTASFARRLAEVKGNVKLSIKAGDAPAKVVEVKR